MDTRQLVEQVVPVTIGNLHREYPNGIQHQWGEAAALVSPQALHPVFFGCYDWHSAVHCHWQLVRALRLYPVAPFAVAAQAALDQSFMAEKVAVEVDYVRQRPSFEMPYGMAWLLQLMVELREQTTAAAQRWRAVLAPLESHAAERFRAYVTRLPYPVRTGLHNQSAFSLGLALDWAHTAGDQPLIDLIGQGARRFYLADRQAPLAYEPSGTDFLSPALAEADLMRRVLPQAEFAEWLTAFLGDDPTTPLATRLAPVNVVDFADGQLSHYSGLNISRAWMLEGIARALAVDDPRHAELLTLATQHRTLGLPDALHPDYMVSHWAPTFALYLLTGRGLRAV
ncbi:MAG: DUF2891 domain-containing protein [Caldilineaceae bacterium]|nr:DUF2891 domain-containing protein [Caldilineaceae bacterium]